tara:strand:+ start:150 stop:356 length:207 start_codon:yes stop_codon:yes gene_type:complete
MKKALPQYRTSDGYTFYQQKDGTLTDHIDPEMSDMVFNSLDDLVNDFGERDLIYEICLRPLPTRSKTK